MQALRGAACLKWDAWGRRPVARSALRRGRGRPRSGNLHVWNVPLYTPRTPENLRRGDVSRLATWGAILAHRARDRLDPKGSKPSMFRVIRALPANVSTTRSLKDIARMGFRRESGI